MKRQRLRRGVLVVGISVVFLAGSAWAMGKKPPETQKDLGDPSRTMKQMYDLDGNKILIMDIGKDGEKNMTIMKGGEGGATVDRSWGSSSTGLGSSSTHGPSSHPGKGRR